MTVPGMDSEDSKNKLATITQSEELIAQHSRAAIVNLTAMAGVDLYAILGLKSHLTDRELRAFNKIRPDHLDYTLEDVS